MGVAQFSAALRKEVEAVEQEGKSGKGKERELTSFYLVPGQVLCTEKKHRRPTYMCSNRGRLSFPTSVEWPELKNPQ